VIQAEKKYEEIIRMFQRADEIKPDLAFNMPAEA